MFKITALNHKETTREGGRNSGLKITKVQEQVATKVRGSVGTLSNLGPDAGCVQNHDEERSSLKARTFREKETQTQKERENEIIITCVNRRTMGKQTMK